VYKGYCGNALPETEIMGVLTKSALAISSPVILMQEVQIISDKIRFMVW